MIDVKTAVKAAQSYFQSLQDAISDRLKDLRLEEIELSEDGRFWLITLGFDVLENDKSPLETLSVLPPATKYRREYKLLKVDAETGEVAAMKIRTVGW